MNTVGFNPTQIIDELERVHGYDISKMDIWTGGLMETTSDGPGELFRYIILDQFVRSRDGDRFWFENELNGYVVEYVHAIYLSACVYCKC